MLEVIQNWNIGEQAAFAILLAITAFVVVLTLWLHVNVEKKTDSQLLVEKAQKRASDEFEAYKLKNAIELSSHIDTDLNETVVMKKK